MAGKIIELKLAEPGSRSQKKPMIRWSAQCFIWRKLSLKIGTSTLQTSVFFFWNFNMWFSCLLQFVARRNPFFNERASNFFHPSLLAQWTSPLPDVLKPAVSGLRHRHGPTENWSPKLVAVEKNGDDKDQTWVRVWFDISHALLRIIIIIIIIMIISKTIQKCIKNHHHQLIAWCNWCPVVQTLRADLPLESWCRGHGTCFKKLPLPGRLPNQKKTPKLGAGPAEIPDHPIPCFFWIKLKQLNPVDTSNLLKFLAGSKSQTLIVCNPHN